MSDYADGMRRAAEECAHEEQVRIWAHDIIEGLGFADVLKISSYDDNIAAHEVVEEGIARVCQSLTDAILAAISAPAPWTPPSEAERRDGYRCRAVVEVWWDGLDWCSGADYVDPITFLPPSPEDAP